MAAPQRKWVEEEHGQPKTGFNKAANDHVYDTVRVGAAANDSSYSKTRRVNTDRSDLHPDLRNRGNTRNVRVSNMPGNKGEEKFNYHKPTDQKFSEEYAKKGLQPSSLENTTVRRPYEPIDQIERREMADQEPERLEQLNEPPVAPPPATPTKSPIGGGIASTAKMTAARAKVRGINTGIWSAGIFTWSFFQLPVALLCTALLLVAGAIDTLKESVSVPGPDDGFFTFLGKKIVSEAIDLAGAALSFVNDYIFGLFGVDLTNVVEGFFMILYVLVLAYGIILLLTIYLAYKLAFLNPLSGKGAGMKKGAFLLAIVGYSVPVLNLFPWFFVWTLAVMRYPK